jgi:hypothetical protein
MMFPEVFASAARRLGSALIGFLLKFTRKSIPATEAGRSLPYSESLRVEESADGGSRQLDLELIRDYI